MDEVIANELIQRMTDAELRMMNRKIKTKGSI